MNFTGYRHTAGKAEQYNISTANLASLWTRCNTEQKNKLVKKMKQQGKLDFVTYEPADSIQKVVIDWIAGDIKEDINGVVVF